MFSTSDYIKKCSRITNQLWIGPAPPQGIQLYRKFNCLVLAAQEYQPPSDFWQGIDIIYAPLDDNSRRMTDMEKLIAIQAGQMVAGRILDGENILCTCQAGVNRSALICALAMVYSMPNRSADYVISKIRKRRIPNLIEQGIMLLPLCNPSFVRFIFSEAKKKKR